MTESIGVPRTTGFGAGMTAHREDPRIEAVARDLNPGRWWEESADEALKALYRERAARVLAAADAVDPRVAQLAEAREQFRRDARLVEELITKREEARAERDSLRAALVEATALAATKFHRYETRDMGDAYHADGVDDLLDEIRTALVGSEQQQ